MQQWDGYVASLCQTVRTYLSLTPHPLKTTTARSYKLTFSTLLPQLTWPRSPGSNSPKTQLQHLHRPSRDPETNHLTQPPQRSRHKNLRTGNNSHEQPFPRSRTLITNRAHSQ
jgi:hypothetical protein